MCSCNLCKLIFDYTSVCNHNEAFKRDEYNFESIQEILTQQRTPGEDSQKRALSQITKTLDVLSTSRSASLTLTQNQFTELLSMFISQKAS